MRTWIVVLSLIFISADTFAYTPKEGNVSAFLGSYAYKTDFLNSPTGVTSPVLGGATLMVIGDISERASLEVAMTFMNKIYFREADSNWLAEQTQLMHMTMGYRRWLTGWLSASLSFFSDHSIGDAQVIHADPGAPGATSAQDLTKYGFDGAIQTRIWENEKWAAVVDFRYSHSVTPKDHEHGDVYGAMIGAQYFIQEKRVVDQPQDQM